MIGVWCCYGAPGATAKKAGRGEKLRPVLKVKQSKVYPPMSLDDKQNERLTEILQVLGAERPSMKQHEANFVTDQIQRHDQYGEDIRLSPKQWNWLEALYQRHAKLPDETPDERGVDDEFRRYEDEQ